MKMYVIGFLLFELLGGCGGTASVSSVSTQSAASKATCVFAAGSKKINVTWTPNREKAVNSTGGGYRVYYCGTQGFATEGAAFVDVPATATASAPTTATIPDIGTGTLYVKVIAYSALSLAGSSGVKSQPSSEITVSVP